MQISHADRLILNNTCRIIGTNINNIRRKRRFTLKKMSRLTGLRTETIDKYELGKTIIALPQLQKIATALETKIENLLKD